MSTPIMYEDVAERYGNGMLHAITIHDPSFGDDVKKIEVTCIGIKCVDTPLKDTYDNVDELPQWVQERIALLMGCKNGHAIHTIGRRVDDSTFWIYGDGK